jgi:hypothetical protein
MLNPTSFVLLGFDSATLWAVNGMMHSVRGVLAGWYGIRRRIFQTFALLGNVNSTVTKSRLCDTCGDGGVL